MESRSSSGESANLEAFEPALFAASVADEIVYSIAEVLEEQDYCAVSLSGGSTPAAVYRALAHPGRLPMINWAKVKLFLGDERWVEPTSTNSNYRMISETLLSAVLPLGAQCFPVRTDLPSPAVGAKDYSDLVRREVNSSATGHPVFDIVLLGLGEDGHTASLFPLGPEVNDRSSVYLSSMQPSSEQPRVSMGLATITSAKRVMFLVKGKDKNDVLKKLLLERISLERMPAQIWRECSGRVRVFADSAAAQGLKI